MKKLLLLSALLIFACSYGQGEQLYADGTATDQEGNSFEWINYGTQDWAIETAEVVAYRDGTAIPQVTSSAEWQSLTTGAWCYFDNDPSKEKLYNWYAVAGIHDNDDSTPYKEFAPEGWHVPTDAEWSTLENHLIATGYNYDGTTTEDKIAKSMAATTGWDERTDEGVPGNNSITNNTSGFNAYPVGFRSNNGVFVNQNNDSPNFDGGYAILWSSTPTNTGAFYRDLDGSDIDLDRASINKGNGATVRFVRGASSVGANGDILLNGTISAENNQIKNVADPTDAQDAVTKSYIDALIAEAVAGLQSQIDDLDTDNSSGCDVVYLDDNGVTIKAYPCAEIGDVGTINGVEYTVVDRAMLDQMVGYEGSLNGDGGFPNGFPNVTKLCTTRVTDMSSLFWDCVDMQFNQPIGSWDVSNVTTMENMFSPECGWAEKEFNQDISNWDVSNVTNMSGLFSHNPYFNQDISNWNTSSVTNMRLMFYNANSFNQDIRNWDVSNVNNMGYMFYGGLAFNQDIGSWDVSNVTDMSFMFYGNGELNAPIGNWDVSNVTNMQSMFENNQEINQDLSSWAVDNVTQCSFFSNNTPQWTLPQPNFINCTP